MLGGLLPHYFLLASNQMIQIKRNVDSEEKRNVQEDARIERLNRWLGQEAQIQASVLVLSHP